MAEGDILLFMDSHCECYPNWLVPLIQHVACDRTSIAVPGNHIDAVSNSYSEFSMSIPKLSNICVSEIIYFFKCQHKMFL